MQTDYIDLLYLHVDDFAVSQLEVMKTLEKLIQTGKIKAIGCSNFYSWLIESAREICTKYNLTFFSVIQQRDSYLSPLIDADFYPQVALNQDLDARIKHYQDITLVAYSPLLKGQYATLDNQVKLENLKQESNPIATVLQYITNSYQGSVALITTSKTEHIKDIMKMYQ